MIYCFRRLDNDEPLELIFTVSQLGELKQDDGTYLVDGVKCRRDLQAEWAGSRGRSCSTWPMESEACGCHPDQSAEYSAAARERGVPTEFRDGKAVFTSASHRRRYCKAFGYFDRNAGYSDPTPG